MFLIHHQHHHLVASIKIFKCLSNFYSSDSITTAASVPVIRTPHEYERDTLSFRYQECKSCENRTELACIKCGFCYSCHWKEEEVEKKQLRNKLDNSYSSLPSSPKTRDKLTTA
ncbi:MAG TPA: hypothetical protein VIP70_04450, partial [Nitrososphaeraceae archaeon]